MSLPITAYDCSTGSPASRFSDTMEPGPRARVSPMVILVRPISTASSTGTSSSRWRSAGWASVTVVLSSAWYSISCDTGSPLLDRDVGEQDLVHLHVGVLTDALEDLLLELLAPVPVDQVLRRRVRDDVRDHVAHCRLLLERAVVLVRRALGLRDHLGLVEHERDVKLCVAAVGHVQKELLGHHVDRARDLRLRQLRRLRQHRLVDTPEEHQHDRDDDLQLLLHLLPPWSYFIHSLECRA